MLSTKEKVEKAVRIIEDCWDENNSYDGKSFDERLNNAIAIEKDDIVKNIISQSMEE